MAALCARMSTTTISLPRPFILMKAWLASALMRGSVFIALWSAPLMGGGQFQAAVLTGCWACRSSYCAGLR